MSLYSGITINAQATSLEAAEAIEPKAETMRRQVLRLLRLHPAGLTDQEIQEALGMAGNTERPRRRELQAAGLVLDTGQTRVVNRRRCVIWAAAVALPKQAALW